MIYIGEREKGYWAEEVALKYGYEMKYIPSSLHISRQTERILEEDFRYMIVDLVQYEDDAPVIADTLSGIARIKNAIPVAYAGAEFLPESGMVRELEVWGITKVIYDTSPGRMKRALEDIVAPRDMKEKNVYGDADPEETYLPGADAHENRDAVRQLSVIIEQMRNFLDSANKVLAEAAKGALGSKNEHISASCDVTNTEATAEPEWRPQKRAAVHAANPAVATASARLEREQAYQELESRAEEKKKKIFVGVAGCMDRIGTTTQALQMVKYLHAHGLRACYFEMNGRGFPQKAADTYNCDVDRREGRVTFSGVDMYYEDAFAGQIQQLDYDYVIYDYGVYTDREFVRASFLEKDIRVLVLGSSPTEIVNAKTCISNLFYQDAEYVFSMVPDSERKDLRTMMQDKAGHTHFAPYAPDMFALTDIGAYDGIFHLGPVRKTQKRSFFGRKG